MREREREMCEFCGCIIENENDDVVPKKSARAYARMCKTAKDGDSEVTTQYTQLVRPMWFYLEWTPLTHATHSAAPVFFPKYTTQWKKREGNTTNKKPQKNWILSTLVLLCCLFVIIQ